MLFDLREIAAIALDEYGFAEDADPQSSAQLPPDLIAHDIAYHHGHYDPSNGSCKYRERREKALEGKPEADHADILKTMDPENVDGEDKPDADITGKERRKESDDGKTSIETLEKALPKLKGVAAKIIQGLIDKRKGEDIGPKLAKLLEYAKQMGLDPSKIAYDGKTIDNAEKSTANNAKIEILKKQIAHLKDHMALASPRLAADFQARIDTLEKKIKNGGEDKKKSDEEKRKAEKKAEKEAKKAAVAKTKTGQNGAAKGVTLDSVEDLSASRTAILSAGDFKKEFDKLPDSRKIYALSDFHDAGVKNVDPSNHGTAIFAGDFTKHGATSHSKNIDMSEAVNTGNEWLQKKFFKFCDKHKDQQIVLIAGNHDHFLGDESSNDIKWPSNVNYLKDSEATINGMRIYGTPWCEQRKGAAKTASMTSSVARQPFEVDDATIKEKFDKIPEGLDVLVVHQTPKADGYDGDLAYVGGEMKHCGSEALTDAIKRAKPKLVICGHLHDGDHRPFRIGDSVVINGAYVANRGDPSWTAHEIGMTDDANNPGFFVDGENNHQLNPSASK